MTLDAHAEVVLVAAWPARLLSGLDGSTPVDLDAHRQQWGDLPRRLGPAPDLGLLAEIDASGLLGRGGAGFPTGRKMKTVAAGRGRRVVVANGCEGEPASGKDSLLLARAPHLVFDGLQLAAQGVGADEAHLVLHRGAPAIQPLRAALRQRTHLDATAVEVHELPPVYVASEESAVVHWLNGGEAKPTLVPPRPFEAGVRRRPTLINNVETLAHVATVARRGAEWFRSVGEPDEPGTLLVTVSGDVATRTVLEVPTGTTIGAVLACVGVGERSQALLVGGYFGSWLPLS